MNDLRDSRPVVIVEFVVVCFGLVVEAVGLILQIVEHERWHEITFIESFVFVLMVILAVALFRRLRRGFAVSNLSSNR